jgi:hypothetical protein
MQTRHSGGCSETAENAVAVIACGAPSASSVVTIVTPAAKEPIAARKSSAANTLASSALRRSAVQLLKEFVVARQFLGQFQRLPLDRAKLLLGFP